MQYTRSPLPRLRPPLILVSIDCVDIGQMKQGRDGRLLITLAVEELAGGFGQNDTDRKISCIWREGFDDDGDWQKSIRVTYTRLVEVREAHV